jgi:hypothetical protein
MANTERSYADRLQRGRELHAASSGFTPGFAPVDVSLEPDAFEEFLDGLDTLNNAVVTAVSGWQDSAGSRSELVTEIKARALRASSRVKSNTAWKAKLPQVKTAADNLRGYRTAKPKPPEDGSPPPKGRQQGDQSFGDIKVLLDKLIAALGTVPGYDASAPADISTAGLQALSTQLDGLNKLVAGREQALASVRSPRKEGYDGENGLSEKMKAIKEATKSQYGGQSTQFLQVKGIRV